MKNVIRNVWRGDYSLWFIVLVFVIVIPFPLNFLIMSSFPPGGFFHPPAGYELRAILAYSILLIYNSWVFVGVWRASRDSSMIVGILIELYLGLSIAGFVIKIFAMLGTIL